MDSVSQFVLGASVGVLISLKKTPKIALISGAIATIPDLDILLDYGNDLLNTVNHRGFSHSLFYLSIFTPFLAIILFKIFKTISFYRWLVLTWFVLITHAILDSFTIYGTALFLPFSEMRVMLGSIFIIDPIYTLPLLFSLIYLFIKKSAKYNNIVLIFSTLYLIFTLAVQNFLTPNTKSFATPTPFNTYLWRVVEVGNNSINEYFINIFGKKLSEKSIKNQQKLFIDDNIRKYANFSSGFYNLRVENNKLILYDLRMGTISNSVFSFVVAEKIGKYWQSITPYRLEINRSFSGMFGD